MSNQPQTRTLASYFASLPDGAPTKVVGQGLSILDVDQFAPVKSIVEGINILVDNTDPQNPVISAVGTGLGDVTGPVTATDNHIALFDGATGKIIKDSGALLTDFLESVVEGTGITIDATDPQNPIISADAAEAGDVDGPASAVDERIAVYDGTTGKLLKDGGKTVAELQPIDADLTAIAALISAANKVLMSTGAGTWALVDFSSLGQGLAAAPDVATARILLSLTPGTDVQAYDADTAKTDVAQQFSKPQRASATALTSGTTITPDLADNNDYTLTLGHNATLANPTNQSTYVGQKGSISCVQDGTGGRTLSFGANWFPIGAATAPAAPTGANAKFRIDFHVVSSTRIDFKLSSVGV